MKKIFSILSIAFFIISCGEENFWDEEGKSLFLEGCERGNNKRIAEEGVNPFELVGTSVEEICECMLSKTMEEFPKGFEDKNEMIASGTKNAQACLTEVIKP